MINILLNAMAEGIYPAVQATGRIKYFQIVGCCISLFSLPLSISFFYWGAPAYLLSVAFLGTAVVNLVVSYYMLYNILGFPVKHLMKGIHLKILPVVLLTLPFGWLFDKWFEDSVGQLFCLLGCTSILTLLCIWLFGLTRSEQTSIINFIRKQI